MRRSRASKKQKKRPRDGAEDVAAAAVIDRAAAAAQLVATAQHRSLQSIECSKLAALTCFAASRPLEQRATEAFALLQSDAARAQPLLHLHHKLDVSCLQLQRWVTASVAANR